MISGCVGSSLPDGAEGEVRLLQVGLDAGDIVVGDGGDGLIHHHLQHKVRAAAKVEAEMDAVADGLLERASAQAVRQSEDAVDEYNEDGEDGNCFAGEILTHDRF